ncbi:hypothetical protein ABIB73_005325 [Bradyrhizobium sp. F1.4.3]|uniref:hypothetical protein n=1 Tax=unclassified Bradyrhizobium TaxID=2631580 RepID=UPI003399B881
MRILAFMSASPGISRIYLPFPRHSSQFNCGVANCDACGMYGPPAQSVTLVCASVAKAARAIPSAFVGIAYSKGQLILIDAISRAVTMKSCGFLPIFDGLQLTRRRRAYI